MFHTNNLTWYGPSNRKYWAQPFTDATTVLTNSVDGTTWKGFHDFHIFSLQRTPRQDTNRPIRLTQSYTQLKFLNVKVLCVLNLHDNVALTFEWYENT